MFYAAYQAQSDFLSPFRLMAQSSSAALWLGQTEGSWLRKWSASLEVYSRLRVTHSRPPYNIASVKLGEQDCAITEEVTLRLPFCSLLHFRKTGAAAPGKQPAVLLVAPLSGHFSTLLRETVRTLLQDHDVYITDWHNARDVALRHGGFGLDDYIEHVIRFVKTIGHGTHVVAVCQPCVAALAATAVMAEDDDPAQPLSLTLMAGPVDCRVNPTEVNKLATSKSIDWFEKTLISQVPLPHAGHMRNVYPGFVQLSAFLSMNLERHKQSFHDLYKHLVDGEMDKANSIRGFYEEYLAVNDLPAEFYLETVQKVFQTYDLALGKLEYRGRLVNPAAIKRTALMTVEGERDDICAVGQTVAAHDLCSSLPADMKTQHVQAGAGHYGVFSGRKWNQEIYPRVRGMIQASEG